MWVFSPQSLGCLALRSLRTLPRDDQELGPGHWRARFRWQSGSRRRNGGDRHHVSKSSWDSSRQRHHAGIAAITTRMISTHIASAIAISRVTISNSPGWPDISAVSDSSWRVELGKRRPSIPMQVAPVSEDGAANYLMEDRHGIPGSGESRRWFLENMNTAPLVYRQGVGVTPQASSSSPALCRTLKE